MLTKVVPLKVLAELRIKRPVPDFSMEAAVVRLETIPWILIVSALYELITWLPALSLMGAPIV